MKKIIWIDVYTDLKKINEEYLRIGFFALKYKIVYENIKLKYWLSSIAFLSEKNPTTT